MSKFKILMHPLVGVLFGILLILVVANSQLFYRGTGAQLGGEVEPKRTKAPSAVTPFYKPTEEKTLVLAEEKLEIKTLGDYLTVIFIPLAIGIIVYLAALRYSGLS